jgi:hypothetical protein
MKCLYLEVINEEGDVTDILKGKISDIELDLLNKYLRYLVRLKQCTLCQKGMPRITSITWSKNGAVVEADEYKNSELFELLHLLRPLILKKEPASFSSVRAILSKAFKDKSFAKYLKSLQYMYDHGQLAAYMQWSVEGQPLFDDSLLRIWLNGTQYHTEEQKEQAWKALEAALCEKTARAVVMNQLCDKVNALLTLGGHIKTFTHLEDDDV